jgi:hypothetical protein
MQEVARYQRKDGTVYAVYSDGGIYAFGSYNGNNVFVCRAPGAGEAAGIAYALAAQG